MLLVLASSAAYGEDAEEASLSELFEELLDKRRE
jgi:hypothetical protein